MSVLAREQPELRVIRPASRWAGPNLRELWRFRELLYFLTWRDLKVRYKRTAIGAAWAIVQPLMTMIVFTVFFGTLAKLPSDNLKATEYRMEGTQIVASREVVLQAERVGKSKGDKNARA